MNLPPDEIIQRLRARCNAERSAHDAKMTELMRQSEFLRAHLQAEVFPRLRLARADDYNAWLRGFMAAGGTPSYAYEYPLPREFRVALSDLELPPGLYGSLALQIIVPCGLTVTYTDPGHCELFLMDGFRRIGVHSVAVYADTVI